MRTTWNGPPRRRRGTSRTVIFSILLMTAASIGCKQEQGVQEGIRETTEDRAVLTPPAQSPSTEETAPKNPKIRFDQPDYDFGEVEAGEEVEHTFSFENAGDGTLSINKVRTSCGCTGALITDKEVPPGGTGEIEATFLTKGFQGSVKKSLTVESNDPQNRLVRLTIGGEVVSEVTVEPRYLNWDMIREGEPPRPIRLTIRFLEGRGLRLEKVRSEGPYVVLAKESESENKVIYSVSLAKNLPTGRITGRLTIRTNSERVPEVHVPFYGQVQGRVKVIPHLLSLGKISPGEAPTRHLSLTKTGKQDFSVQKVKTTTTAIATEIIEEKGGARYRIKVTYTPGSEAKGRISERITIFVNDGEESFLEVPLYGTVDQGAEKPAG